MSVSEINSLENVEKKAYIYLMEGKTQACTQTTLLVIQEELNKIDKLMIKACSLMAGGSRVGSLCGALVGGLLAIGMEYGVSYDKLNDHDELVNSYKYAKKYYNKFEQIAGSRFCPEIIGFDLNRSEEREKWVKTKGQEKCARICGRASREALKIINNK